MNALPTLTNDQTYLLPETRARDMVGTGVRQTWHQWCSQFGSPPCPDVEKFEDPWRTLWRSGMKASEAGDFMRENEPDSRSGPDWWYDTTGYIIEREGGGDILSCRQLIFTIEHNLSRGIPIMDGLKRSSESAVRAALEWIAYMHATEPCNEFAAFVATYHDRLKAFCPGAVRPRGESPPTPKEPPMAKKPSTPAKPKAPKKPIVLDEQPMLIDTNHPAKKEIASLVRQIRECDEERSAAQEASTKAREELASVMHEHNLTQFRIGEFVAKLRVGKDKVSVRKAAEDEDGD